MCHQALFRVPREGLGTRLGDTVQAQKNACRYVSDDGIATARWYIRLHWISRFTVPPYCTAL